MFRVTGYNEQAAKDICYHCGSPTAKKSYNYFRRMLYESAEKVWSVVWWDKDDKPVAFYFASRCRSHVRLIEIAVREEYHKQGVGKKVLLDLLLAMKRAGLYKLTFRTPIVEEAQKFWLHMGAKIVDVKGDDYEMTLTIKQDN